MTFPLHHPPQLAIFWETILETAPMRYRNWWIAGLCLLSLARAAPAPVAAYAGVPSAGWGRLSPDGNAIAYIDSRGDQLTLHVSPIDHGDPVRVALGNCSVNWLEWKDSQTLLLGVRQTKTVDGDVSASFSQIVAVSRDGKRASAVMFKAGTNVQDDLISDLPAEPNAVLVEAAVGNGDTEVSARLQAIAGSYAINDKAVVKADLWDYAQKTLLRSHPGVVSWGADQNGVVRVGYEKEPTSLQGVYQRSLIARRSEDDGWHHLALDSDLAAFSATDPNVIYALVSPDQGNSSLVAADIASGAITSTLVSAPKGTLTLLTDRDLLQGYSVQGGGVTYLDPQRNADAAAIGKITSANQVTIENISDGRKQVTVLIHKTGHSPELWLLDKSQSPASLSPMLQDYDQIPAEQIATPRWTSFKARDGVEIPLLLTLPPQGAAAHGFVVLVHGGPTEHDTDQFDWIAQFLASRGWGVLQPQFRGSSGFGADFEAMGKRQWGLAMQDDVTDATQWLIAQKLAQPGKICIAGASYGGYAALEGAAKQPGLYACVAAIAPVTDLPEFLHEQEDFSFSDENIPEIGGDRSALEAVSPALHADRIQSPVLLIHGKLDFTVPVRQTMLMEHALQSAGKTEKTIYLPQADHYFSHSGDRLVALQSLEDFFSQYLN